MRQCVALTKCPSLEKKAVIREWLWGEKRREEGGQPLCKETADLVLQAEPVGQLQVSLC